MDTITSTTVRQTEQTGSTVRTTEARCRQVESPGDQATSLRQDCVVRSQTTNQASILDGKGVSFGGTFAAGGYDGAPTVLIGGRAEVTSELIGNDYARLSALGSANAAIGNGLQLGGGLGARGELGTKHLNVYGSAQATLNAGISMNGATAGVGVRTAVGAQAGVLFGEVAHERATNMNMTSATAGIRINF